MIDWSASITSSIDVTVGMGAGGRGFVAMPAPLTLAWRDGSLLQCLLGGWRLGPNGLCGQRFSRR